MEQFQRALQIHVPQIRSKPADLSDWGSFKPLEGEEPLEGECMLDVEKFLGEVMAIVGNGASLRRVNKMWRRCINANVRRIELRNYKGFSHEHRLDTISLNFRNLKELVLPARFKVTSFGSERLRSLQNLRKVTLNGTNISRKGIQWLEDLTSLRVLCMWIPRVDQSTPSGFTILGDLTQLKELELHDARGRNNSSNHFVGLIGLRSLRLWNSFVLLADFPSLTRLEVHARDLGFLGSHRRLIFRENLNRIGYISSLDELKLHGWKLDGFHVSAEQFSTWNGLSRLRLLSIERCFTQHILGAMSSLTSMQELVLKWCRTGTLNYFTSLMSLSVSRMFLDVGSVVELTALTALKVYSCYTETGARFTNLTSLRQLSHLELVDSGHVHQDDFDILAAHIPHVVIEESPTPLLGAGKF
ncbi:unnamed protein product [Ostreobium quekettii]|uniref:Uncharacterized protein n=1 Tax=Ostreobium quekettii TaxID=121088 RepID=A0A8S1IPY9_9CHLO|nr:unnamed protein product [Ostreobium quekettii]